MPIQVPEIEIHDESARIVKGWGTVDVFDNANERLPIGEFKRIMPIIMKRGGIIMNRHTNQTAGKILNYEFRMKDTEDGPREGVYLTTQAFDDFDSDDETWNSIKNNDIEGFSFGGKNTIAPEIDFTKGISKKTLKGLEGYEFSYVPKGCNKESTIEQINYIAKEDKETVEQRLDKIEKELDLQKPEKIEKVNDSDDKTLSKSVSTLDKEDKNLEKFIKNSSPTNNMTEEKDTKKIEEVPQATDSMDAPQDGMAQLNAKLDKLIEVLTSTQKASEDEKPKDEPKDKPEDDVSKEGDGEKVKLPESEGDEVAQAKPAEGDKGDEAGANFLAKEGIAKIRQDIKADIMKELQVKKADTPRPGVKSNDMINKSSGFSVPKNWAEANQMIKKAGLQ